MDSTWVSTLCSPPMVVSSTCKYSVVVFCFVRGDREGREVKAWFDGLFLESSLGLLMLHFFFVFSSSPLNCTPHPPNSTNHPTIQLPTIQFTPQKNNNKQEPISLRNPTPAHHKELPEPCARPGAQPTVANYRIRDPCDPQDACLGPDARIWRR